MQNNLETRIIDQLKRKRGLTNIDLATELGVHQFDIDDALNKLKSSGQVVDLGRAGMGETYLGLA